MATQIPVILFAYARPDHLRRTLECLRADHIPILYIFIDGPKTPDKETAVQEVRKIIREIDWCKTIITERENNLGLGQSILAGVTEVLQKENAAIVFEDDLICVPGTYAYLCAAMENYRDDDRIMSVTGWTHPLVTPKDIADQPYLDGRAECLVWGTWSRVWKGMDTSSMDLIERCNNLGIDPYRYGADLPAMASVEQKQNICAVRFLYWHILSRGLCLRPPWSMVEHIGWDSLGTNATEAGIWAAAPLEPCPPIPETWPEPIEHTDCPILWQKACGARLTKLQQVFCCLRSIAMKIWGFCK